MTYSDPLYYYPGKSMGVTDRSDSEGYEQISSPRDDLYERIEQAKALFDSGNTELLGLLIELKSRLQRAEKKVSILTSALEKISGSALKSLGMIEYDELESSDSDSDDSSGTEIEESNVYSSPLLSAYSDSEYSSDTDTDTSGISPPSSLIHSEVGNILAEAGNILAEANALYHGSEVTEKNVEEALKLYEEVMQDLYATGSQKAEAHFYTGKAYLDGNGVAHDLESALEHLCYLTFPYNEATEEQRVYACFECGTIYAKRGVERDEPVDYELAMTLLKQVIDSPSATKRQKIEVLLLLGDLQYKGLTTYKKNWKEALSCYQQVLDEDDDVTPQELAHALSRIGKIYFWGGNGVSFDFQKAHSHFKQARALLEGCLEDESLSEEGKEAIRCKLEKLQVANLAKTYFGKGLYPLNMSYNWAKIDLDRIESFLKHTFDDPDVTGEQKAELQFTLAELCETEIDGHQPLILIANEWYRKVWGNRVASDEQKAKALLKIGDSWFMGRKRGKEIIEFPEPSSALIYYSKVPSLKGATEEQQKKAKEMIAMCQQSSKRW